MRIITQTLSAASLAVVMSVTSLTNAFAMPLPTSTSPKLSQVEQVQMRRDDDRRDRRGFRDRRAYRNDNGWYNGQRGYTERRAGYRRHSNGFWYPLAAFGAAAIIGGAIASQPRLSGGGSSHVEWCADRYRSYRASDNTYSPRAGVRAQCNSPY